MALRCHRRRQQAQFTGSICPSTWHEARKSSRQPRIQTEDRLLCLLRGRCDNGFHAQEDLDQSILRYFRVVLPEHLESRVPSERRFEESVYQIVLRMRPGYLQSFYNIAPKIHEIAKVV